MSKTVFFQRRPVTIIEPHVVTRVGYPFDHKARAKEILASWPYKPKFGGSGGFVQTPFGDVLEHTAEELANSLAVDEAKRCNWGGNEREVFLSGPIEALRDLKTFAFSKRIVMEGERVQGRASRTGDDDGFSTHFVFKQRILLYGISIPCEIDLGRSEDDVEIPAAYVRFDDED